MYSMHIFSLQCYNSSLFVCVHIARLGLAQEIVHTPVNYNFKVYSSVSLSLSQCMHVHLSLLCRSKSQEYQWSQWGQPFHWAAADWSVLWPTLVRPSTGARPRIPAQQPGVLRGNTVFSPWYSLILIYDSYLIFAIILLSSVAGLIYYALCVQAFLFSSLKNFPDCELNMFLIQLITAAACVSMTTDLGQKSP